MTKEAAIDGVVIYTDGSARPKPGEQAKSGTFYIGSGVYGYCYHLPRGQEKPTKTNAWVATTKGYVLQQDLAKAQGVPVVIDEYLHAYRSYAQFGTNNSAEINAVGLFFEAFESLAKTTPVLHVLADSEYTINGLTKWIPGWIRNGWLTSNGAPVSNREDWERVYAHVLDYQLHGAFSIAWVEGHSGNYGNDQADHLSVIAMRASYLKDIRTYQALRSPKDEKALQVIEMHPFFSGKRIYYNTDAAFNEPGVYYQASWTGHDYIHGKRTGDTAFSILRLNTPDPVIEEIIQAQVDTQPEVNEVMYLKQDRVRSPDVYPYLRQYGRLALQEDPRNHNLLFLDGKPVTFPVSPGELELRAVDALNTLDELLLKFLHYYRQGLPFAPESVEYQLTDVTEHFYETLTKKFKKDTVEYLALRKTFVVGQKKTDIEITVKLESGETKITLPFLFMDDLPSRNALKNVELLAPEVYVLTWQEAPKVLRYATIIKTDDSVSIWSNLYANQRLL